MDVAACTTTNETLRWHAYLSRLASRLPWTVFRLGMDGSMENESGIASSAIAVGPHSEIVAAATRAIEQYAGSDWAHHSQEPFDGVGYDGQ